MRTFDRLNGRLNEDFGVLNRRLNENLTARGLGESSIYGDKFSDLGTEQIRAQSDLANQVNEQAASQDWNDRLAALSGYNAVTGQQFRQEYDTASLNDRRSEAFQRLLAGILGAGG
jgi:hypothetical protein